MLVLKILSKKTALLFDEKIEINCMGKFDLKVSGKFTVWKNKSQ